MQTLQVMVCDGVRVTVRVRVRVGFGVWGLGVWGSVGVRWKAGVRYMVTFRVRGLR